MKGLLSLTAVRIGVQIWLKACGRVASDLGLVGVSLPGVISWLQYGSFQMTIYGFLKTDTRTLPCVH